MTHALVTIVAPLDPDKLTEARRRIEALGNPAGADIARRLGTLDGDRGVHFMSLHALQSFTAGQAYLLLEASSDGDTAWAVGRIVEAIGDELGEVFSLARDWKGKPLGSYLEDKVITTGFGLGAHPGIGHIGSPDMTVGRIRREQDLYLAASAILDTQGGGMRALDRLDAVRKTLRDEHGIVLGPAEAATPKGSGDIGSAISAVLVGFVKTYLWPWLLLLGLLWLALFAWDWYQAAAFRGWAQATPAATVAPSEGWWARPGGAVGVLAFALHLLKVGLGLAIKLAAIFATVFIVIALVLYAKLRSLERSDWISSRAPDPETLAAIDRFENQPGYAQNHMISVTERKSGWLRYFTQRLAFFAIATLGAAYYKAGYLGRIGTIHFARWVTVPGTRDLIFLSNYGGSWESYLEDFITLAHEGLTGAWSSTVGFPRSSNVFGDGATDGERFKRYARQSMLPTLFWYSAYPELDTDMIRANADIRRGLSGAMTEDAAQLWLSRFGSTLRPDDKLVTSEIQSLVFGGLGFLRYSTATFWELPGEPAEARGWLADLSRDIAWNDGRRIRDDATIDAIVQLGLSADGLAALELPADGLQTFPAAFRAGMEARARVIGDVDANAPEQWWWRGRNDAVVLVYGETEAARDAMRAHVDLLGARYGARLVRDVPLRALPGRQPTKVRADAVDSGNAQHNPPRYDAEPFGFADGISQPLIQGTYKAERAEAHPLHIVAPGEFIIGYPDGRGNLPPSPQLDALHDPGNLLPVLDRDATGVANDVNRPRDLGRNGSFLVVRQLEQNVDRFKLYCAEEADKLARRGRLLPPYRVTPEFIGAKMVGRWQNGAPLVRSPYSQSKAIEIIEENAFLSGFEDPEGLRCPFGAHIRRANPRDSLNPGSTDQVEISNRHRLLRVGRKYEPAEEEKPGLLFMCLNGDLERQFEFVQQTWLNGNVISLSCPTNLFGERDPVMSSGKSSGGFTIPTRDGPVKLSPLPNFVTMRGGGYFFMPGKRLVNYLSKPAG